MGAWMRGESGVFAATGDRVQVNTRGVYEISVATTRTQNIPRPVVLYLEPGDMIIADHHQPIHVRRIG